MNESSSWSLHDASHWVERQFCSLLVGTQLPWAHYTEGKQGNPDPGIWGSSSRVLGHKMILDSCLLLSQSDSYALFTRRACHARRLLVLWLLKAGPHWVVDRCWNSEKILICDHWGLLRENALISATSTQKLVTERLYKPMAYSLLPLYIVLVSTTANNARHQHQCEKSWQWLFPLI